MTPRKPLDEVEVISAKKVSDTDKADNETVIISKNPFFVCFDAKLGNNCHPPSATHFLVLFSPHNISISIFFPINTSVTYYHFFSFPCFFRILIIKYSSLNFIIHVIKLMTMHLRSKAFELILH